MPELRVVAHDVPQDRPVADGTIGLGMLSENSRRRSPWPPQNSTTFNAPFPDPLCGPHRSAESPGLPRARTVGTGDIGMSPRTPVHPWAVARWCAAATPGACRGPRLSDSRRRSTRRWAAPSTMPIPEVATSPMRILVTGSEGYIGTVLAPYLMDHGHDVVGLDTGFHRIGWLYNAVERSPQWLNRTSATLTVEDLRGFDAVVHLAELSNDPLGALDPGITSEINHQGSVRLAATAKEAGVGRFIYDVLVQRLRRRPASVQRRDVALEPADRLRQVQGPRRARRGSRGRRRLLADLPAQRDGLRRLAAQRFDLVVNDLAGHAWTEKVIRMDSDGTPVAAVRPHPRHQPGHRLRAGRRATSSTTRSSTSAATTRTTRSGRSPRSSPRSFPGCSL